jgi:hypothetical protein
MMNKLAMINSCEIQVCTILICTLYSIKYGKFLHDTFKLVRSVDKYVINIANSVKATNVLKQLAA